MTKIIPTRYDNTKCRACKRSIAYGENVRWTKGEKGVTCMSCPGHVATPAPVDATTTRLDLTRDREELRSVAAAAHAEIARLNGSLAMARDVFVAQRAEIAALKAENARLNADRRTGPLAQLPVETIEDEADEYDRDAQLFRRTPSRIELAVVSSDDDCPI